MTWTHGATAQHVEGDQDCAGHLHASFPLGLKPRGPCGQGSRTEVSLQVA